MLTILRRHRNNVNKYQVGGVILYQIDESLYNYTYLTFKLFIYFYYYYLTYLILKPYRQLIM